METPTTAAEAVIVLTPAAIAKIKTFFTEEPAAKGKALRVAVERGGCSGYSYAFVFDEKKDGDVEVSQEGFSVIVDPESGKFLKGSIVDYHEDVAGAGFKIQNPNVKKSCGCGNSHQFQE
jgi:iron-sulfur cluster assembly protein